MAGNTMAELLRHGRCIAVFWSTALEAEMEYQFNLVIELVAVCAALAGNLLTLSLFYGHASTLGGWSWDQALMVLGLSTLMDGIAGTWLRPNLNELVKHVQNGSLDFVLLKPLDSQIWLSLRTLSPWGLPEMLGGLVLVAVGWWRSGLHPGPWLCAVALLMLISGITILYSLWFLLAATSIWFVKIWNATEVLRSLLAAGRYPVSAYPATLRWLFTSVLPIAFLTTVPAEVVLGRSAAAGLIPGLLMAVIGLIGSRALWHLALRHYTSASS